MESNQKQTVEDFPSKESRTEFDAVHPRFAKPEEVEVRQYQTEHDYFCEQCDMFFAPTVRALKYHFKSGRISHTSCGSCFYCKGPVYEYGQNNVGRLYHICETTTD